MQREIIRHEELRQYCGLCGVAWRAAEQAGQDTKLPSSNRCGVTATSGCSGRGFASSQLACTSDQPWRAQSERPTPAAGIDVEIRPRLGWVRAGLRQWDQDAAGNREWHSWTAGVQDRIRRHGQDEVQPACRHRKEAGSTPPWAASRKHDESYTIIPPPVLARIPLRPSTATLRLRHRARHATLPVWRVHRGFLSRASPPRVAALFSTAVDHRRSMAR